MSLGAKRSPRVSHRRAVRHRPRVRLEDLRVDSWASIAAEIRASRHPDRNHIAAALRREWGLAPKIARDYIAGIIDGSVKKERGRPRKGVAGTRSLVIGLGVLECEENIKARVQSGNFDDRDLVGLYELSLARAKRQKLRAPAERAAQYIHEYLKRRGQRPPSPASIRRKVRAARARLKARARRLKSD